MELIDKVGIKGKLIFTVYNTDGSVYSVTENDNTMITAGVYILANAMMWASISDQNANMGSVFTPFDLTPVYGAIGGVIGDVASANPIPASTDSQLAAELSSPPRTFVTNSAYYNNTFTSTFLFGTTSTDVTINEAGIFVQATSEINSGTMF